MKKILVLFLSFLGLAIGVTEGSTLRVVDQSGKGLPYSSVKGWRKAVGALSDSLGNVTLPPEISASDSVVVSYPGCNPVVLSREEFERKGEVMLEEVGIELATVNVLPRKMKKRVKGKRHRGGMFHCSFDYPAGETFGYEFHAGKGKRNLLTKVGFYYCIVDTLKPMQKMNFRLQVYDMKLVTSDPTNKFIPVGEPIYFDYEYNEADDGKYVFQLPEVVELPKDAMVAVEVLSDQGENEHWLYKCNGVGRSNWDQDITSRWWMKGPFAPPFFMECLEVD